MKRPGLRLTQAALAAVLLGVVALGDRPAVWPLVQWSMYSGSDAKPPPTSAERHEARYVDADGRARALSSAGLLSYESFKFADLALRRAARDDPAGGGEWRQYVAHLIAFQDGTAPDRVEVWRVRYDVDPFAVPCLDRDRPAEEERLGEFDAGPGFVTARDEW